MGAPKMTKLSKSLLNNDLDNFSLCFILQKNLVNKALEKNLEQKLKKLLWNVIKVLKKMWAGTLFDTVGVVDWSYGKFGEFVV